MERHSSISFTLGFLILTGCSQSPAPDSREANAHALREGEVAAFVKDWGGKNADRIAAHYAGDGNVMIPNSQMMTGKDAIGKAMKDALADPNWSLAFAACPGGSLQERGFRLHPWNLCAHCHRSSEQEGGQREGPVSHHLS